MTQLINKSNVNQRIANRKQLFSFGQRKTRYGPFALIGHMLKFRHTGWQKNVASSAGTSRTKESQA